MTNEMMNLILIMAARYPSGDNAQPFAIKFLNEQLEIWFLPDRAKHEFDFAKIASCLTLGCLIFSIQVSAEAKGFKITTQLGPLTDTPTIWCKINFKPCEPGLTPSGLIEQLNERKTCRTVFRNLPRPDQFIRWISQQKNLKFKEHTSPLLMNMIHACQSIEEFFWKNELAVRDLFKMVHFNEKNYLQKRTGIFWKELGIKPHEVPLSILFKKFPRLPKLIYHWFFKFVINDITSRNLKSSSVLICLPLEISATQNLKSLTERYVELGQQGMELWLQATKQGLLVQPLSNAALLGNLLYMDFPTEFLKTPKDRKLLHEATKAIALYFDLEPNFKPGWIFRIGCSQPNAMSSYRSLRTQPVFS